MEINPQVLYPFLAEIRRIEREYGLLDRPDHQYQCLMIEARDCKNLLKEMSKQ